MKALEYFTIWLIVSLWIEHYMDWKMAIERERWRRVFNNKRVPSKKDMLKGMIKGALPMLIFFSILYLIAIMVMLSGWKI